MYDRMLYGLNRLTDDLNRLHTQTASGLKYEKPSDAPVDLVRALSYRKSLEEIDRYQTSIREGVAFLRTMEGALEGLENIVVRAKQLALQGANDDLSPANREALAKEVDSLLQEALSLANTKHGTRYVFAGNRPEGYENGELPFELERTTLGEGETVERVVYHGGAEDLYQGYGTDQKILIGKNGEEVLSSSGLFETLISLKKTLLANNQADAGEEVEEIGVHIDRLDEVLAHLTKERTDLGARMDHLQLKENLYEDFKVTIRENLSDTEEVDFLEVATRLKAKETAYQAALAAAAKVMNMSLVNYL
jgi:flagellar hook-associated protein 3 FlgL